MGRPSKVMFTMGSLTCSHARLGMAAFTENVAAAATRRWTHVLVLLLVFTLAGTLATCVLGST